MSFSESIIIEIIKILIIGGLAFLVKFFIEENIKERDEKKLNKQIRNKFKTQIIDEFVEIFSGFYQIRKMYHSTFIQKNYAFDDSLKKKLIYDSLIKSTELESRYGNIKVRLIIHYGLPTGDWETKKKDELKINLENEKNFKKKLRLQLDLLGEYYDIWRNSIESGQKISTEGDKNFYGLYEEILKELGYRSIIPPTDKKNLT